MLHYSYRNSHITCIIARNIRNARDINTVKIDIRWIFFWRIAFYQNQLFMALFDIEVSKPANPHDIYYSLTVIVDIELLHLRCIENGVRNNHVHPAAKSLVPEPNLILLEIWKHFLVFQCIHVSNNHKTLVVFEKHSNVVSKQRERRVRNHDVRLVEQR